MTETRPKWDTDKTRIRRTYTDSYRVRSRSPLSVLYIRLIFPGRGLEPTVRRSVILTCRIFACCKDFSPLPCTRGRGVGGEGCLWMKASPLTPTLSPEYRGEGEFGCGSAALCSLCSLCLCGSLF